MMQSEIEISLMDDGVVVQRWPCTRTAMPDGSPGVIWRGVAYPLLPGDRIEIGAPHRQNQGISHAVVAGEEATWILLQGLPATLQAACGALARNGVEVSRSGRWLGEPADGVAYDWFLRCVGAVDPTVVANVLGAPVAAPATIDAAARVLVLEQRIADLLAELARVELALRHAANTTAPAVPAAPTAPDPALIEALEQLATLRRRIAAAETSPVPPSGAAVRLRDEVAAFLAALRPDVRLLRNSLTVVVGEFESRVGFYRAIRELPSSGARPDGWKTVHAAEKWWESHMSNGRDNTGRAYARFDTKTRQWGLLVGWKSEQAQDIAWLQRQA
jgi:hypothetical protein